MAAIRTQGGWSGGQAERMPDRYTRDKQLIALTLQEECLRFWRGGGTVSFAPLDATIASTAQPEQSTQDQPSPSSSSSGSSEEASF
eukprot:6458823-Amphidinium_carterae.1